VWLHATPAASFEKLGTKLVALHTELVNAPAATLLKQTLQ
jgi:hypothetical protein